MGFGSLAFAFLGHLGPHFADTLEDHVHVAVEGFYAAEQLSVVATVDHALAVGLYGLRKQSERPFMEDFLVRRLRLSLGLIGFNHFVRIRIKL